MAISSSWTIVAVVTVAVVVFAGRVAEGQSDCVAQLIPCADYLNSTKPSAECCEGMKKVVATQLSCLCGLINNPAALGGINMTQALELPKYCNISSDTSICKTALAPRSSSTPPPPATPGGSGNGAGSISWMGMPAFVLASAFAFFY